MPNFSKQEIDDLISFIYKYQDEIVRQTEYQKTHGQHLTELLGAISDNGGKSGLVFWLKLYQFFFNKLTIAIGTFILLGAGALLVSGV